MEQPEDPKPAASSRCAGRCDHGDSRRRAQRAARSRGAGRDWSRAGGARLVALSPRCRRLNGCDARCSRRADAGRATDCNGRHHGTQLPPRLDSKLAFPQLGSVGGSHFATGSRADGLSRWCIRHADERRSAKVRLRSKRLVMNSPVRESISGRLDRVSGRRRHSRRSLTVRPAHFDGVSVLPHWLSNRILCRDQIDGRAAGVYDSMAVAPARSIHRRRRNPPFGKSIVCVAALPATGSHVAPPPAA